MLLPDIYPDFASLAAKERRDIDYRIAVNRRPSPVCILAPHGGGIEPGTSEVAAALAGRYHSLYLFEGLKATGSRRLHITAANFDEPTCLDLVKSAALVVTIHGCSEQSEVVFLGGLDFSARQLVHRELNRSGIQAKPDVSPRAGVHPKNLCNLGRRRKGLQLELSLGVRRRLFSALHRAGRQQPAELFDRLVRALHRALDHLLDELNIHSAN